MKNFKVGLQLYSVREDMEKDMEATLKKVKEIGYDYVEFAGYFGHTAEQVREWLDKYGLTCVSVHQGYEVFLENEQAEIDYLKTIGAKFCAVPWMGVDKHKGSENFEQTVADFKKVGTALKNAGIQMLYHNHDFEFIKLSGQYGLDFIYDVIPAEDLATELDTCWVNVAGENPSAYIRKYAGRCPVVHLKDFVGSKKEGEALYALIKADGSDDVKVEAKAEPAFDFRPVGYGVQDIPSIIKAGLESGAEWFIVEQDRSSQRPPLEAAKMSCDYVRGL